MDFAFFPSIQHVRRLKAIAWTRHARGVRQGDPLSPMLFILAMDPLQRLLDLATQQGILTPLPITAAKWRTSMYADDAAIFVNPTKDDVEAVKIIL